MPRAIIENIRTISTGPAYIGWPTVARRADGELLTAYSGGREAHVCPYGKVHLIRSRDDGETWSAPVVLARCAAQELAVSCGGSGTRVPATASAVLASSTARLRSARERNATENRMKPSAIQSGVFGNFPPKAK